LIDLEKRFSRKRSLDLDLSVHSLLKFSRNDMLRLHIWRRREDPQISQQPSLAVSRHRAQHSRISTLYHLPAISQLHTPCEEPHAFKLRQASSPMFTSSCLDLLLIDQSIPYPLLMPQNNVYITLQDAQKILHAIAQDLPYFLHVSSLRGSKQSEGLQKVYSIEKSVEGDIQE